MKTFVHDLNTILDEQGHVLPDQAPLEYFVHHNNLHAYENTLFEAAVESVFLNYGRSPYMPFSYYRSKFKAGEIDLEIFREILGEIGFNIESNNLLNFLAFELYQFMDEKQIQFYRSENMKMTDSVEKWSKMNSSEIELWKKIDNSNVGLKIDYYPDFHANRSIDKTSLILIPFISIMLDQGQAEYQLSDYQRENFWPSFLAYLGTAISKKKISKYLNLFPKDSSEVDQKLEDVLGKLNDKDLEFKIKTELHSIPGWAGMINKMEHNKEVIPRKDVFLGLKDYLLMRLIVNEISKNNNVVNFKPIYTETVIKENIFNYLQKYNDKSVDELIKLFKELSPLKLKRSFQFSYEKTYQYNILTGIKHLKRESIKSAKHQMFFCIDDRECSFRRYVEEFSNGGVQTFGVAGFFGLDIVYQKVGEPRWRRLCPPAVSPKYLIKEEGESFKFKFARMIHYSHSSFIRSAAAGFLLAPWKTLEFKLHLYAPRLKRKISNQLTFSKLKDIHILNDVTQYESSFIMGYKPEDLALKVAGILKGSGLVTNFGKYVYMIGHGHDSFNNPHVSAYRCGACSGANAYPNAKVFAKAANNEKIRKILAENHNIVIPESTYFIGAYHDTCNDDVKLFDIDHSRMTKEDFIEIDELLLKARQYNALERSKKFYQTPSNLNPQKALSFVEERAWRIAEPRPELNHATNALCIVGRRSVTKNLFLDRKAFLVSYDATIDPESLILAGILGAVIPVCAGINLEYYFSKVDTENYGSGSKTSHNVTGLFGVMNGIRGDLRTGLVWQMVEYHDPLRILFVIEATEDQIFKIMSQNEEVSNLIKNYWINLAIIDPNDQNSIKMYRSEKFVSLHLKEREIPKFKNSSVVPTGLDNPVHVAFIEGDNYGL